MWAIVNKTPYKAGKAWARDKNGVHEWLVAVKGTFDIQSDGSLQVADEQLEPLLAPEYNFEEGVSSIRYDADVVSTKPTTDIIINGTAYAPGGRPSKEFLVGFRLGSTQKEIKVVGNRVWERSLVGLTPSLTQPVIQVPIVYEKAYGGMGLSDPDPKKQRMDPRNPVGCGLVAVEGQLLPNFKGSKWPGGFGVINNFWSPRRELTGTYDKAWQEHRMPLLPIDWDPRSLLCSPVDQRPQRNLRGGELVQLSNLTPDGILRFMLPKLYFTFRTRIDKRIEEHRSRVSMVIIEPDFPRVIMVWSTSLKVKNDGDYLEETEVREKPFQ